jgi:hypothetical protein
LILFDSIRQPGGSRRVDARVEPEVPVVISRAPIANQILRATGPEIFVSIAKLLNPVLWEVPDGSSALLVLGIPEKDDSRNSAPGVRFNESDSFVDNSGTLTVSTANNGGFRTLARRQFL